MAFTSGTFEDTVLPRCKILFARFERMKLLWGTLDFTAAGPDEQAEAHFYLDCLEGWMQAVEEWDAEAGGVMPEGSESHG